MKKRIALGLALGAGIVVSGAAQAKIKFGVGAPITGPSAAFGAQLKSGAGQAVADINAAGGILGKQITWLTGDGGALAVGGLVVDKQGFVRRGHLCRVEPIASTPRLPSHPKMRCLI
jgi:ABC-type branched-subunit amino acid transport system substrate-binding protein